MTELVTLGRPDPLAPRLDLRSPRPLRVCFPVLLDGDLVMSTEHLGVGYLSAVLRNAGVECRIVELGLGEEQKAVIEEIASWQPDVIGITLTTIGVEHATHLGAAVRERLGRDVFVIAGGPLATFKGAELLGLEGWEFLDGLVRGEGEIAVLRLAEALHAGASLATVPNLVYRTPDGVRENPITSQLHDLDLLPDPARDQFEAHDGKLAYLRVSTSRGCTAHCTFCNAPHARNKVTPGKLWRGTTAQRSVDEIERLMQRYNFNTFDFIDSTFEDPGGTPRAKERIAEIAREILSRRLRIYYNCCMQAKNWSEADRPLIDLLYESGLEKVLVGIESGSASGLAVWDKMSSVEDNSRVIRLLRGSGIYVAFGFISFHPYSTFEEIRENMLFLRENMGHNLRRYTVRLELYPGAEIVETLRSDGLLRAEYDRTLNPFAYEYRDPRVAALASGLNGLYGRKYEEDCTIEDEPSVFEFETYDIVLHTYMSRLQRFFGEEPDAAEILNDAENEIEGVKHKITEYNYSLIGGYVDLAERERLTREDVWASAETTERFFRNQLDNLRSIQLRTSVKLHRAGYSIRSIQRD